LNETENVHPYLETKVIFTKETLWTKKFNEALFHINKSHKAWTRSDNTRFLSHAQTIEGKK